MARDDLRDRIEERIREIPSHNPGYISPISSRLGNLLSAELLHEIAEVAAAEARKILVNRQID